MLRKGVFMEATLSRPMTSFVWVRILDFLKVLVSCRPIIQKPNGQALVSSSHKRESFIIVNYFQKVQKKSTVDLTRSHKAP